MSCGAEGLSHKLVGKRRGGGRWSGGEERGEERGEAVRLT